MANWPPPPPRLAPVFYHVIHTCISIFQPFPGFLVEVSWNNDCRECNTLPVWGKWGNISHCRQVSKTGDKTTSESGGKSGGKTVVGKGAKDPLRKIEGIGPKIEGLLHDGGILTFGDLANAKISRLNEILEAAGPRYQMHSPDTWPQQSKLAAAGKWEELEKLQDKLDGGRK